MSKLNGWKTYVAAACLMFYQAYSGDFASVMDSFNALVGPLLMVVMRKITAETTQKAGS